MASGKPRRYKRHHVQQQSDNKNSQSTHSSIDSAVPNREASSEIDFSHLLPLTSAVQIEEKGIGYGKMDVYQIRFRYTGRQLTIDHYLKKL